MKTEKWGFWTTATASNYQKTHVITRVMLRCISFST